MMKNAYALILLTLINVNSAFSQDYKIYSWEEVVDANPDTIFAISFAKDKREAIPEGLMNFVQVRYLDLSKNRLVDLPDDFSKFQKLEVLNLGKNYFEIFPIELCSITTIKILQLYSNRIESVPECIQFLVNLEYLDLYNNPLSDLPIDLSTITSLKKLDISGIKFSSAFHEKWTKLMSERDLSIDPPCACMD